MSRRDWWSWISLCGLLIGGAIWATWRIRAGAESWRFVVLWLPLLLVVGWGTRLHRNPPVEYVTASLPKRLAGMLLFLVVFGGLDASMVYGELLWQPMAVGFSISHLLIGWGTDWSRNSGDPIAKRRLRQVGYFTLGVFALGLALFGDPFLVVLPLGGMELLLPPAETRPSDTKASETSRSA